MNIFYSDNTLYVTIENKLDDYILAKLKKRVFNILDDYDIDNIVLNVFNNLNNNVLLDDFVNSYHQKYNGTLEVKNM